MNAQRARGVDLEKAMFFQQKSHCSVIDSFVCQPHFNSCRRTKQTAWKLVRTKVVKAEAIPFVEMDDAWTRFYRRFYLFLTVAFNLFKKIKQVKTVIKSVEQSFLF